MQAFMATENGDTVERALAAAIAAADEVAKSRLAAMRHLLESHPRALGTIRAVLHRLDHDRRAPSPEAAVADIAAQFDQVAEEYAEAAVALYALGDPALLEAATAEVVMRMVEWSLVGREHQVLEIGCGIGRFVAALAPHVAAVTGLDVSPRMIAEARARCAHLENVRLACTPGRDLEVPSASFDFVLAADVFPYLVQAGIAAHHLREAHRVLRPGGSLLILNYSYRGDEALDDAEVEDHAATIGLVPVRTGPAGFTLWDARAYHLRRAADDTR
jgi:ubiquinone/menaquinone biosynthesis C-methylase UbiE